MFTQMNEQLQNSFKPVSDLLELNYKVAETLAKQQSSFFTDIMSQGLAFTQNLASHKDLPGMIQAQKEYGQEVQDKLITASKEAYTVLTEAQGQASEVMTSAFAPVVETIKNAVPATASKTKTAK